LGETNDWLPLKRSLEAFRWSFNPGWLKNRLMCAGSRRQPRAVRWQKDLISAGDHDDTKPPDGMVSGSCQTYRGNDQFFSRPGTSRFLQKNLKWEYLPGAAGPALSSQFPLFPRGENRRGGRREGREFSRIPSVGLAGWFEGKIENGKWKTGGLAGEKIPGSD